VQGAELADDSGPIRDVARLEPSDLLVEAPLDEGLRASRKLGAAGIARELAPRASRTPLRRAPPIAARLEDPARVFDAERVLERPTRARGLVRLELDASES
jgi:hypothetical protein